ncbi:hypothetical protein SG34_012915 [Thalassomonas viridans]|uniref:Uncharacterized protein n=1 Tax=Thalassomonas viridans TaxID=137584 RepID=A0AAF0CBX4_9GAMM|nr:hypothetical protein [Thalassomonas viridans]WDE07711.1 hypothetical protein SG34_012915 [Thalassomonas viridans]
MKFKFIAIIGFITGFSSSAVFSADDATGRKFVAETPDAIVCILNNTQQTKYIYYKRTGAEGDLVRYDGPNGYLLHYDLPSGSLLTSFNPRPASADCVYQSQKYNLQTLISEERAYKILTPMPASTLID